MENVFKYSCKKCNGGKIVVIFIAASIVASAEIIGGVLVDEMPDEFSKFIPCSKERPLLNNAQISSVEDMKVRVYRCDSCGFETKDFEEIVKRESLEGEEANGFKTSSVKDHFLS